MGSLRVIEVCNYEIKGFRGKAIDGVRISSAAHGHAEFSQYEFKGTAGFDIGTYEECLEVHIVRTPRAPLGFTANAERWLLQG